MACKPLMMALLGSALLSAPAFAQTQSPSQPASPNASSSTATSAAPSTMSSGNWMTQEKPGQWRASKLEGLDVYNNNNEKIGDISELLVDDNGQIQAVIIGVGGFLGIGEKDVAVPFESLEFMSKEQVQAMDNNNSNSSVNTTGSTATTGTTTAPGAAAGSANTATTTSSSNQNKPERVVLRMTKAELQAAPAFDDDGDNNANRSTTGTTGPATTAPKP